MTNTDTDALTERIARAFYENRVAAIESDQERRSWPAWEDHEKADADEWRDAAAAVLPIVEEEVRKAAKEAWDQCAMEQATWPRPAGDPRALTFVLLANNPYGDEEKR